LRYLQLASPWGFALHVASKGGYDDLVLSNGSFAGTPEEALDSACGLSQRSGRMVKLTNFLTS
jgi:hypothetical protein